jgi:hypothetical protein
MEESAEATSTFIACMESQIQTKLLVEHGLQSDNGDASTGQKRTGAQFSKTFDKLK